LSCLLSACVAAVSFPFVGGAGSDGKQANERALGEKKRGDVGRGGARGGLGWGEKKNPFLVSLHPRAPHFLHSLAVLFPSSVFLKTPAMQASFL